MFDFSQCIDLTSTIGPGLRLFPGMAPPEKTLVRTHPEKGCQVSRLNMTVHSSTHADAPRHFLADGPSMEMIPVEKFCGEAVLVDLSWVTPGSVIGTDYFESQRDRINPGDIVVLYTRIEQNPDPTVYCSLTRGAAEWLVDRGIKCLAGDIPSVDPVSTATMYSSDSHPAHHTLLSAGIPIVESLVNLDTLPWTRFCFICLPLKIEGSDGAPARVIALPLEP